MKRYWSSLINLPLIVVFSLYVINPIKAVENSTVTYVAATGADIIGNGSVDKPFKTIQYALNLAQPGTTIFVKPGIYKEHLVTKTDGTAQAPIILQAQGKVVLKGADNTRLFDLFHDYYILEGFEFDGGYNDTKSVDQTIDKLLWVETANFNKIRYNYFHHAQGECIRNLFFSEGNVYEYNTIENCGLRDFVQYRGESYKNGEGIYIGISPGQIDPAKCKSDQCKALIAEKGLKQYGRETYTKNITVKHNFVDTHGNECVDIKEGSSGNIIVDNACISQYDPDSAAFDTRGPSNSFIHNTIGYFDDYSQYVTFGDHTSSVRETGHKILGAAFRAGGSAINDAINNNFVKNKVIQYQGKSNVVIKVSTDDTQNVVCQNEVAYLLSGGWSDSSGVVNAADCPSDYKTPDAAGARGCVGYLCQPQSSSPTPTLTPSPTITPTLAPTPTLTPTPTASVSKPASPQNLTAVSPSDSRVNLSWEAVPQAAKYKLYWTYSGWGGIFRYKKATSLTKTSVTDARSAQVYSFYVTAVAANGVESPKSNVASILVK